MSTKEQPEEHGKVVRFARSIDPDGTVRNLYVVPRPTASEPLWDDDPEPPPAKPYRPLNLLQLLVQVLFPDRR